MFESIFAFVAPVIKDVLLAAAAALLTYVFNKVQSKYA